MRMELLSAVNVRSSDAEDQVNRQVDRSRDKIQDNRAMACLVS